MIIDKEKSATKNMWWSIEDMIKIEHLQINAVNK